MQPQHLAITPSEAKENDLKPSQSELVASAPATPATANELELSQSELAATAPAIPATANELELQLSILPERNETQWQKVREAKLSRRESHLALEYSLPLELLDLLYSCYWLYAGSEKAVFTARTLYGEARFPFVLDELGNFTTTHPLSSEAAFWVATTGEIE